MEIKKTFHKRQLAIAVILTAILVSSLTFSATWLYAGGALSSPGTTYGPGDVDGYSFVVFEEGGTYYAKNCSTRVLDYSSTNASQVINNCFDSTASVLLKNTEYVLDAPIIIDQDGSSLKGESYGGVILSTTSDINLVYVGTAGANTAQITVSNLLIHGNDAGTNAGLYIRNVWYSTFENINARYNYIGIDLYGESVGFSGGHVTLEDIEAEDNLYAGIRQARHYSSTYRHVSSHNNDIFGIYLYTHAQGIEMYGCFASQNNNTGLYIVGVGTGYIQGFQASDNDYGIRMRDGTMHWTLDNVYTEASTYQGLVIEAGTNTGPKYNSSDILISNSYFVKAEYNGVQIKSWKGYNVSQVRFINTVINNNGLDADDTYYGVYITDDANATSYTHDIWFTQCWVGNDNEWSVDNFQRGISSSSNSDYVHAFALDTQSATSNGISLLGANNHVAQSWNLTTWCGIWNGTGWIP